MAKKLHDEARWYKIGFDEGRSMGATANPPLGRSNRDIAAYERGFADARALGF
jgi:hypothetical protein